MTRPVQSRTGYRPAGFGFGGGRGAGRLRVMRRKNSSKRRGTRLTTGIQSRKIRKSAMRDLIRDRLSELGMTRYELGKAVAPHVSLQAVYGYLAGRRDMTSGLVWHLLTALRLEIRPKE